MPTVFVMGVSGQCKLLKTNVTCLNRRGILLKSGPMLGAENYCKSMSDNVLYYNLLNSGYQRPSPKCHVFLKTRHGKKFLDIRRRGKKKVTVDNTTIHSFPNITGHVLYFNRNNKAIVRTGKQAQFM